MSYWWNGIAYGIVAGTALVTLVGLRVFVPALRKRWFPLPRLRPGTWTGNDVFLACCIYVGFQHLILALLFCLGFFTPLIGPAPDTDAPRPEQMVYGMRSLSISSPIMLTVILGMLFAVMFARSGSRPHHYGLSWARWPANLGLGIVAFVLTWPLIIGVFALSVLVYPPRPDPVVALGALNPPLWEWVLLAFQTTVMAPVLEEIVCRGILQGWLRRASLTGHLTFLSMTLFVTLYLHADDLVKYDAEKEEYTFELGPPAFIGLLAGGYGYALYRLTRQFALSQMEIQQWQPLPSAPPLGATVSMPEERARELRVQARQADEERKRRWAEANARLAIFGSAMLFAAMHPVWPAPVALFLMGLVLGWLYQRTQSLVGTIAFHALFNLTAFIALYGSVLSPSERNGNAQTTAVRPSVVGSTASSVPASQLPLRK